MATFWARTGTATSSNLSAWSTDPALKHAGAAATVLPTSSDDVVFSATTTSTLNLNAACASFRSLTWEDGSVHTLNRGTVALNVAGSVRLVATGAMTGTGATTLTGGGSIRCNGGSFSGPVTLNAPGLTYTLEDALTLGAGILTLTAGTFATAGFTITATSFASTGTAARTWSFGSSTWNLSATNAAAWSVTGSGITGDAAGCTVNVTGTSATMATLALRIGTVNATGAGNFTVSPNALHCDTFRREVDFNGAGLILGSSLNASTSVVIKGTTTNYIYARSSAVGTQRNVSAAGGAAVSLEVLGVNFEDISLITSGTGSSWSVVSQSLVGDAGNFAPGPLTPDASSTLYLRGNGWLYNPSAWSTAVSGAITGGRVPLAQDDVIITENAQTTGSADFTVGGGNSMLCRNLTILHKTKRVWFGGNGLVRSITGNLTVATDAAGAWGGTGNTFELKGRLSQTGTIDCRGEGKWWVPTTTIAAPGSTYNIVEGTRMDTALSMNGGTLNLPANLYLQRFTAEGSAGLARTINMQGTHLRLDGTGSIWATASGSARTLNVNTSTVIESTDTSMSNRTVTTNAGSAPMTGATCRWTVDAPGGTLTISYFPNVTVHGTGKTVLIGTGPPASGIYEMQGTAASPMQVKSNLAGTARAIATTAGNFRMNNVTLTDLSFSNAQTAYSNSSIVSNVTNVTLDPAAPPFAQYVLPAQRGFYARIQEDLPAWYVGANNGNPAALNERGPFDRAVTTVGELDYDPPLVREGLSAEFSGNDYSTMAYRSDDQTAFFTIEWWFKGSASSSAQVAVAADFSAAAKRWISFVDGTGKLGFSWFTTGGAATPAVLSNKVITDNLAHHCVTVFDTATATTSLYIDGALDTVVGSGPAYVPVGGPTTSLGAHRAGALPLVGTLDEMAYYTRALTAEQVFAHYDDGRIKVLGGKMWVHNGTTWVQAPVEVNGQPADVLVYNGTQWVLTVGS